MREISNGHRSACHRIDDIADIRIQAATPESWSDLSQTIKDFA
jgi:hypothetical protein